MNNRELDKQVEDLKDTVANPVDCVSCNTQSRRLLLALEEIRALRNDRDTLEKKLLALEYRYS